MPNSVEIKGSSGTTLTPHVGRERDEDRGIDPPSPDQRTASTSGGRCSCIPPYGSQN